MNTLFCPLFWNENPIFHRGILLVKQGVRLSNIMWDADEILWDWLMSVQEIFSSPYRRFMLGDVGHREFFRRKHDIFELLLGMHVASVKLGLDPYIRIWTNGYSWRLWRISQEIPCLIHLLGPAKKGGKLPNLAADFEHHPRIFSRKNYVSAIMKIAKEGFSILDPELQTNIVQQFKLKKFDSSLKEPDFARIIGKSEFEKVNILVDDKRENVDRFVQKNRIGIVVPNQTPHILYGKIKNIVWKNPWNGIEKMSKSTAESIANALEKTLSHEKQIFVAKSQPIFPPHDDFIIEAPDARIRLDWVEPMRKVQTFLGK